MEITTWIILMNLSFVLVSGHYQNANYEHWMRQVPRRPVDVMTDVINSLGINILQQYHVPGNVAFSPTGLGFVLISLYEGSAGRGTKQIAESLQLPHDRQITRIGLRDIHRRLRSYLNADGFLGGLNLNKDNTRLRPEFEEVLRFYGFDFKIDSSQMNATDSTTVNINGTTTVPDTMNTTQSDMNGTTTMATDGSQDQTGNSTSPATDSVAAATTISPTGTIPPLTDGAPSTTPINPPTTTIDTSVDIITVTPNNSAAIRQSTSSLAPGANSSTTVAPLTAATPSTAGNLDTPLSTIDFSGMSSTTQGTTNFGGSSPETTIAPAFQFNSAASTQSDTSRGSQAPAEPATRMEATTSGPRTVPSRSTSIRPLPITLNSRPSFSTLRSTTSDRSQTSSRVLDSASTMRRPRMSTSTRLFPTTPLKATTTDMRNSTITEVYSRETTDVPGVTTGQPSDTNTSNKPTFTDVNNVPTTTDVNNTPSTMRIDSSTSVITDAPTTDTPFTTVDDSSVQTEAIPTVESPSSNSVRRRRSVEHFFSTYPDDGLWMQHLNIWRPPQEPDQASVRDSKQVAFLVNGCDVASVSAATYTAVLPFAYFPSLKAVAVEFPLDNPRYNVILFLPTERPDTLRLAIDLGTKSLRLLRKHLQPTWIRATIPSFMLKGFVTLTPYLQRLGIRDVFEPRAADLSPMTPDLGVYARDVQQSIGVNIRNYMEPDRTSSSESSQQELPLIVPPRRDSYRFLYPGNGLLERAGPVSFVAEHPFLYFIIDTETTATLIAGRIDDPLNSRIL